MQSLTMESAYHTVALYCKGVDRGVGAWGAPPLPVDLEIFV